MKSNQHTNPETNGFYGILLAAGLLWLHSVYGKLAGGMFVGALGKTLGYFASENPYGFMKTFLTQTAIPNSEKFALLTMGGELYAALVITIASILMIRKSTPTPASRYFLMTGLAVGAFLNVIFYFAAGWTSPSTWSINIFMAAVQLIGIYSLYNADGE